MRELRDRTPGMMTLVAVAISVAYVYSAATVFGLEGMPFFWELATLIDIMLLGHWIEMRSVGEASKALESLAELMPSQAHRRNADGSTDGRRRSSSCSPATSCWSGPARRCRPTATWSRDARRSTSRCSPASRFRSSKSTGDQVIGGSVNGEGALAVAVARTGAESFLSQVIELVREAQESKSTTQDLADRAAMWLTIVALGGGALTFAVWLALGEPLAFAMERAVTVMVIACPHALGLAIPLVVAVSTASRGAQRAARPQPHGVRERAARSTRSSSTRPARSRWAASASRRSSRSRDLAEDEILLAGRLGRGALGAPDRAGDRRGDVSEAPRRRISRPFPGRVREARSTGATSTVVSPGYLRGRRNRAPRPARMRLLRAAGPSSSCCATASLVGAIALSDIVRPESRAAVRQLKEMGIETIMLTGDNAAVAARVAAELGIDGTSPRCCPPRRPRRCSASDRRARSSRWWATA